MVEVQLVQRTVNPQHFAHPLQMRFFDAFNNAKDENAKAVSGLCSKFQAQTAAACVTFHLLQALHL